MIIQERGEGAQADVLSTEPSLIGLSAVFIFTTEGLLVLVIQRGEK